MFWNYKSSDNNFRLVGKKAPRMQIKMELLKTLNVIKIQMINSSYQFSGICNDWNGYSIRTYNYDI